MKRFARSVFSSLLLAALSTLASAVFAEESKSQWPEWDRFAARFVQADGRVIDVTFDGKTTSEGMAYGMFFALVANRRDQFDTLLKWTENNLTQGGLDKSLPGWLWGKRDDGTWGIKDSNAASDADLWMAYALLEASRLWHAPAYERLGRRLLEQIAEREVVKAGDAGVLLLPGPIGFELSNGRYRINPSYLPEFMFRYLAMTDPRGPWKDVWNSYAKLEQHIYSQGVAPDIVIVDRKGRVEPDSEKPPNGSYDAIRVYLWAGMTNEPRTDTLRKLAPFAKIVKQSGHPPEKVNPLTGGITKADFSPLGFTGAVIPFLATQGDRASLNAQLNRVRLESIEASLGRTTHYYDQVLLLFGKGWYDEYFRFDRDGRVMTKWK